MTMPTFADVPNLEAIHWLSGSWHGEGLGGHMEEVWSPIAGGTMLATFRLVVDDKVRVIEYIMVTAEADRVVLRFKHFRTDFTTWEEDRPLEFTLVEATPTKAVFHSAIPEQHSPRRIVYDLMAEDRLQVTVAGSADDGEINDRFQIQFTRE